MQASEVAQQQEGQAAAQQQPPPQGRRERRREGKAQREGRRQCEFFVAHKGRRCKMEAVPGHRFCGNHFLAEGGEGGRAASGAKRVVCPYDPKGSQ